MHHLNNKQIYIIDQMTGYLSYVPRELRSVNLNAAMVLLLFEKIRSFQNEETVVIEEAFTLDERRMVVQVADHFLLEEEKNCYQAMTGSTLEELSEIKNLFERTCQ